MSQLLPSFFKKWTLKLFYGRIVAALSSVISHQNTFQSLVTRLGYYTKVQLKDQSIWQTRVITSRIPRSCKKVVKKPARLAGAKVFRALLQDGKSAFAFFEGFKMCHKIEGTETVVFICPYGNVTMSFKPEDHHLYAETYRINKWRFLDVDIDAHLGIDCSFLITGPLAGLKNVIMFILEKKWAKDGNLYYEVVLPDSQKSRTVHYISWSKYDTL